MVLSGGQQGIDLMFKAFIDKGDVVLVEDPTYLAVLQILNTYEGKAIGVRSCDEGLDLDDLENKIIQYKPKMLYCVPTFSNPTGRTYTTANRKEIASLTARYGVMVLEDDPYSLLRFSGTPVPPLKSFDVAGNVVYVTSFSKIISPGLRVGAAVGDPGRHPLYDGGQAGHRSAHVQLRADDRRQIPGKRISHAQRGKESADISHPQDGHDRRDRTVYARKSSSIPIRRAACSSGVSCPSASIPCGCCPKRSSATWPISRDRCFMRTAADAIRCGSIIPTPIPRR